MFKGKGGRGGVQKSIWTLSPLALLISTISKGKKDKVRVREGGGRREGVSYQVSVDWKKKEGKEKEPERGRERSPSSVSLHKGEKGRARQKKGRTELRILIVPFI